MVQLVTGCLGVENLQAALILGDDDRASGAPSASWERRSLYLGRDLRRHRAGHLKFGAVAFFLRPCRGPRNCGGLARQEEDQRPVKLAADCNPGGRLRLTASPGSRREIRLPVWRNDRFQAQLLDPKAEFRDTRFRLDPPGT